MAAENLAYNNEVKKSQEYAITITFKHLHCKSPKGMFKETSPYLTKLLSRSTNFSIIPEFRHTTGDIHYHGIISIVDYIKWHKSTLPSLKSLGYLCIKPLKNDLKDGWVKYYHKEIDIANSILGELFPLTRIIEFKKKTVTTEYHGMDDYIVNCLKEDT